MTAIEVATLTEDAARRLTNEIRHQLAAVLPLIKRAYEGRADRALGYASWQDYCAAELAGVRVPLASRPEAVAELRAAGMSTRAIGSALGVDQSTVVRDLRATDASASVQPERITSLDGRERPATRPETPATAPEPAAAGIDVTAAAGHPDHPATGEADARLDAAVARSEREAPDRGGARSGAGDNSPAGPPDEMPVPSALSGRPGTKPTDPLDDPEQVEAERRQRSSQDVATALVSLLLRLDPDPIRWLTRTWQPDAYRNRDLPRVRTAFTTDGLRLISKHLDTIADHLDRTGGSL